MLRMVSLSLVFAAFSIAGCSSDNPTPNPTKADGGGAEGGSPEASPGGMSFSGRIFDLGQKGKAVAGATVTAAGLTATTDATGAYSLPIPLNTPFSLGVTAPGYYKLIEQETLIKGTVDRGKTYVPSDALGAMLNASLPGYTDTLGGVGVAIEKAASCPSEAGSTLTWTVDGGAPDGGTEKLVYFTAGFPSQAKSAQKDSFPHALIYNVAPGKKITVSVTPPTGCTAAPFPVDVAGPFVAGADSTGGAGTLTFTVASVLTEAGKATSFLRVFLK